MKITESNITKLLLTDLDRLDPVKVFLEDLGKSRGQITITCFGEAWTSYWGGMGEDTKIIDFFLSCDEHYIAKNLSRIPGSVVDYDKISDDIGNEVDRDNLQCFGKEMSEAYGYEWYMDLPQTSNHEYEYLCRIILAVQAGLKEYLPTVE